MKSPRHSLEDGLRGIAVAVVCAQTGVTVQEIVGRSRCRRVAHARHVLAAAIKRLFPCSLADVGLLLGGRDHSTIAHSLRVADPAAVDRVITLVLQRMDSS